MGLQDLKKRFAASSRSQKAFDSDFQAPAPTIPMDSRRVAVLQAHNKKERASGMASDGALTQVNHVVHPPTYTTKETGTLPTTLRSNDDSNSAAGEPLFQDDFPARSIQKTDFEQLPRTPDPGQSKGKQSIPKRGVRMNFDELEHNPPAQLRRSRAQTPIFITSSREEPRISTTEHHNGGDYSTQEIDQTDYRQEMPLHGSIHTESDISPSPVASRFASPRHSNPSVVSVETKATSVETNGLPPLQTKSALPEGEQLEPLLEDDPASFELVLPEDSERKAFQLEERSEQMFSREHLLEIFKDTPQLLQFTNFLSTRRPKSVPLLVYYLDALKALKAIRYANAVAEALEPLDDYTFSKQLVESTVNSKLEKRAQEAFDALVKDELPAFITHTFIRVVSLSITRRITGTLPAHLREASEGLAEVFCLTDPNREDNPIIFSSEEFHRTTQYGVNYAIGRNCRFLQGPRTNKYSVERFSKAVRERKEVCEIFLNYRRDGSPFMNLLMIAPLLDSKGNTRYFIGAQVDVSGLCKEATDLPALQHLIAKQKSEQELARRQSQLYDDTEEEEEKDCFQELAEMFNETELNIVRRYGGNMHHEQIDENDDGSRRGERPRLLIKEPSDPATSPRDGHFSLSARNGKLEGVYQSYLLVRPYPSLRILFCSPTLRVPGILQSPFLDRIGGSSRVRETLVAALADGRGVTAKVRWISGRSGNEEGRPRWIHCTPLLGQNGAIGVWMVVLIEDEQATPNRKFRQPPPVDVHARAKQADLDMFDPAILPESLRGRHEGQDAERPSSSVGPKSLESFNIE